MPSLADPIKIGALQLPNRIVMAPLTRSRATRAHVPTDLMRIYYEQRAGAGLIITEATGISRQGLGWPFAPGIWTMEQAMAWQPVVEAVHTAGGRIVCQLWHMGRIVHSSFNDGAQPVSASATTAPGQAHTYDGRLPYEEARPLSEAELADIPGQYAHAAAHAIAAGFDGVQIHSANGYLLDQFLRDGSNHRTDGYGGAIENRIRLLREVTEAVVAMVGADRTGVRLSPNGESQGVNDSAPHELFPAAAAMLDRIGIAFLELREPGPEGTFGKGEVDPVAPLIRKAFRGALILNSDYTPAAAEALLQAGAADAISFGRPFIGNPDLVARIAAGHPLAAENRKLWYSQGAEGYIDYPAYAA